MFSTRKKELRRLMKVANFEFKQNFFTLKMLVSGSFFLFVILSSTYGLAHLGSSDQGITTPLGVLTLDLSDPECVLSTTSPFIAYLTALLAVVFGFSAVTQEFSGKKIDMLATRPISPGAIVTGKLLGVVGALSVPVTISLPLVVLIIRVKMGAFPSLPGLLAFWSFTVVFMATFVLFSFLFGLVARSVAEAVTFGVSLFLLYTFFWPLLTLLVQALLGFEVGIGKEMSEGSLVVTDVLGLLNPVVNYQNAVAFIFERKEIHGMPPWVPSAVLVLTALGLLFLVRRLFRTRLEKQNY